MKNHSHRINALTDEIHSGNVSMIVDTVCAPDTKLWETAVTWNGSNWFDVEQYENETDAKIGHQKWIDKLIENPRLVVIDIYDGSTNGGDD
jgi:hypothetical protein